MGNQVYYWYLYWHILYIISHNLNLCNKVDCPSDRFSSYTENVWDISIECYCGWRPVGFSNSSVVSWKCPCCVWIAGSVGSSVKAGWQCQWCNKSALESLKMISVLPMSEMWGIFLAGNQRSTVVVLKAYLDFFLWR